MACNSEQHQMGPCAHMACHCCTLMHCPLSPLPLLEAALFTYAVFISPLNTHPSQCTPALQALVCVYSTGLPSLCKTMI